MSRFFPELIFRERVIVALSIVLPFGYRLQKICRVFLVSILFMSSVSACSGYAAIDNKFEIVCPRIPQVPQVPRIPIVYWSMWLQGEPQMQILHKAAQCFQEQTGIPIEIQWLGRKLLTTNVAPALNLGNAPDIFDQDVSQIRAAVADSGGTVSVSDVMRLDTGEGKSIAQILNPADWKLSANFLPDGAQIIVPYEQGGYAWWYDKSKYPHEAIPQTIDELFAAFAASRKTGIAPVALDGDINFYSAYYLSDFMLQFVGPGGLLSAVRDKTGQSWKTHPGFLRAAQVLARFARGNYLINGWNASKFPNIQNQWAAGAAKYIYMGSWIKSEVNSFLNKDGSDPLQVGTIPMPHIVGAPYRINSLLPIGFAMSREGRNQLGAKYFIAYTLNAPFAQGFAHLAENMSARKDIPPPTGMEELAAQINDPHITPVLIYDGIDGLESNFTTQVFYPLNYQLLEGKITAQEFISRLSQQSAQFWKVA